LLWLNSNSNGKREQNALHAACPIIEGITTFAPRTFAPRLIYLFR